MGVSGLWDIIGKAGQSRSLAHLAVVNGFEDNGSGKRTYRVGIDASIWFKHAAYSKGGENPELRLLFFRQLRDWAELPFSLLFVFDGHERPKIKRGSKMGKSGSHNLMAGMKKLLEIFGIEWRLAPGEAEAELAHLNKSGVIDAVLTDDVDALVFGALTIIKNPGLRLTGNKANPAMDLDGKASKNHAMMCTADAPYCLGAIIMIGVERFGPGIAYGLARCGFGDRLLEIVDLRAQEDTRLAQWREDVHLELRTNSRGFLPKRCPSCVLPANFPPRDILEFYIYPVTSAQISRQGGGAIRDTGDMSLARLAAFCETHFGEWGHASAIIKRFRDLIWEAAVMHILRRAALEADEKEKTKRINAGSRDLSIRGPLRPSVDEANNDLFDVNFVPSSQRRAPKGPSKLPPDPESVMRMWLPASMIQQVHPELIQNYEADEAAKRSRKAKGKGKARAIPSDEDMEDFPGPAFSTSQIPVVRGTTSSQSSVRDAPVSRSTNFPPRSPPPNEHSLPTTPKGFLFWFPDPDDPDMLIPEDGLPLPQTRPSIIPPPLQPPRILFAPPSVQTMPQPVGSSSRRPVHPRTIASSSAPVAATYDHLPLSDHTVEPPRDD
ncbi:hypothetical protein EWM64_g4321 [Hericium alpestre]|uniref:XPG-I domain-containing protein n=1 Tax=Hericium alpestre TaxID=135208 RepID=A0A4Z0A0G8_9AGAM|nr:hypothetical protein EWM64_g4321 [Hericium alpestre]